jgi:hypothetical protein
MTREVLGELIAETGVGILAPLLQTPPVQIIRASELRGQTPDPRRRRDVERADDRIAGMSLWQVDLSTPMLCWRLDRTYGVSTS